MRFLIIILMLVLAGGAAAETVTAPANDSSATILAVQTNMAETAAADTITFPRRFEVGEQLVFDIYVSVVKAGTATMTVESIVEMAGRQAYRIVLHNRTDESYSKIYPVNDVFETYLDVETLLPLKFYRKIEEGKRHKNTTTYFDQAAGKATYVSKGETHTVDIPRGTQDTLSIFYVLRTLPVEVGKPLAFDIMESRKVYELKMKPVRKVRKSIYGGRAYDTIQVQPISEYEGEIFTTGSGWLYLSDDGRNLPVLFRATMPFATITFALVDVRNIYNAEPESEMESDTGI